MRKRESLRQREREKRKREGERGRDGERALRWKLEFPVGLPAVLFSRNKSDPRISIEKSENWIVKLPSVKVCSNSLKIKKIHIDDGFLH